MSDNYRRGLEWRITSDDVAADEAKWNKPDGEPLGGEYTILDEARDLVLDGQRQADYGPPGKSFDDIARIWSVILGVEVTGKQVVTCMIGLKVARAANGGYHRDSFLDIAGYVQCLDMIENAP